MKTIAQIRTALLLALAIVLSPVTVYGQDTEIFFSRAKADNDENEPVANVFIMLDTSGSMRWCQAELSGGSGHNATWCTDHTKRRINVLQNALKKMLNDTPDGVRIGLGRFNYRIPNLNSSTGGTGQIGGRVLVPVLEMNDDVRALMFAEIDKLNDAGTAATGPYPGAQPAGDTPTGRAYAEAARYMMGMAPLYGTAANEAVTSVCLREDTREVGCREVFDYWTDYEPVAFCNVLDPSCKREYGDWMPFAGVCNTALETCMSETGAWQPIAGTCNTALPTCQMQYTAWTNMAQGATCNTTSPLCQSTSNYTNWVTTIQPLTGNTSQRNAQCPTVNSSSADVQRQQQGSGSNRRCEERYKIYQTRAEQYFEREINYFTRDDFYFERKAVTRTECDLETYCAESADIISGGKYISPMNMENQCESNHVILFTDGQPSANDTPGNQTFVNCGSEGSYDCQVRISNYLHSDANAKKRKVKTYNIGLYMGNAETNMRRVSTDGASGTINADDGDKLIKAFADIINLIADDSRSFSAPGVAVNQMNRLQHLDQLYYAVFEPRKSSYWHGNLKRYRVVDGEIRAANGPAVDESTGFFAENARSFWSSEVDGADVRKGGAREFVGERRLFYTNAANTTMLLNWTTDNSPALYGLPASATADQVNELKQELKQMWGDPLHSEPVLVNYGGGADNNVIFVSGNAGMLHAIRSTSGKELFSFMPHEMMSKANQFTVQRPGLALNNDRQLYGMDGSWTAWRRPGATASSAPSKVYLYGGMRRGGFSYYALDATNLNSPSQMWRITRGSAGFERLGQTWSQPTLTQVKVGGNKRAALVFGGGYSPADHDERQGQARSAGQDAMGNMIYVVDALSGQLLWSAGATGAGARHTTVADMRWAVPASISVVDVNFDGVADFLYFADLGGQIFRVDIGDGDVTDAKVRKVADVGGVAGGASNNRRFFYAPSISYVRDEDTGVERLYLSIGSGYREHPLDETVDDFFYVIRDDGVTRDENTGQFVGSPVSLVLSGDLDLLSPNSSAPANPALRGWRLPLVGDGEKALAAPVVFGNRVFFTTYEPGSDTEAANPCVVRIGTSYLYVVDLITGAPAAIRNDGAVPSDRRRQLRQDVPPPSPTLLSDGEEVLIIVGTEVAGGDSLGYTGMRRGSWYQLRPGDPDVIQAQ